MIDEPKITPLANVPSLTELDLDDAAFRGRDLAWSAVVEAFIQRQEDEGASYQTLGDRIHRSRSQVQRWLKSAYSMNIKSLGVMAEGLNADLIIQLIPRRDERAGGNEFHPSNPPIHFIFKRDAWPSAQPTHFYQLNSSSSTLATSGFLPALDIEGT